MAVYVDDMYTVPMGQFRRMKMSHLIADTDEELHAMAAKIGVARKWFQGDHYDIAISKRTRAIALGAIPVTMRTLSMMCFVRKKTGSLCHPQAAEQEWQKLKGLSIAPGPAQLHLFGGQNT